MREGYGNCRACRRMWKARGKRGRPSAGRAALPAALPQPPWKTARLRRVGRFPTVAWKTARLRRSRPVSHSSHSPGDDDERERTSENPLGVLTNPTCVTYVPGLKCHPCLRSFMLPPLRGSAVLNVNTHRYDRRPVEADSGHVR